MDGRANGREDASYVSTYPHPGGTLVIACNTCKYVFLFRKRVIMEALKRSRVVVLAPYDGFESRLRQLGAIVVCAPKINHRRPASILSYIGVCALVMAREPGAVFLPFTIGPNIIGSLVAALFGLRTINNVTGLGSLALGGGWSERSFVWAYSAASVASERIVFQNEDDRRYFVERAIVPRSRTMLVPGSGVDLDYYNIHATDIPPSRCARNASEIRYLFVGRLIRDKGVAEFVAACQCLSRLLPAARFVLVGGIDIGNPSALSLKAMAELQADAHFTVLGELEDVRGEMLAADVVVLPSYREGTPRSLLEAAALRRPVITSTAVGCREVVIHGVTGFACEPRSVQTLFDAMLSFSKLDPRDRQRMGERGRRMVECRFDERVVAGLYMQAAGARQRNVV